MPLRPELLERARAEGRLEDAGVMAPLGAERAENLGVPASGTARVLVLLIDFPDLPADTIAHSLSHFRQMLFGEDSRSMRSFYRGNSYERLDIVGDVYGWFRAPSPLTYYANQRKGMGYYPKNAQRMIEDTIDLADSLVDFSLYDNDGPDGIPASGDDDGLVDYLLVVHGGQGFEWTMNPDHIHSHAATIRYRQVDGVAVRSYATEPEDGRVGTFAHELGHLFGLPDLYDVTLNSFGLGMWSLMGYGSWGGGDGSEPVGLDAYSKVRLGFVDPVVIDSNYTGYRLPASTRGPHVLKLWNQGAESDQYFLVENRKAEAWDSYLYRFGEGLLIYHVDERYRDNSIDGQHLVRVEQADGRFDLEERRTHGFGSDAGDPYPGDTGNRTFSWWTAPDNHTNEGLPTQVSLEGISDAGEVMTFDLQVYSPVVLFEAYGIDDGDGDDDGEPDPGETFLLELVLENYGIECGQATVTLSVDDPFVSPAQSSLDVGRLEGYARSDPLGFQLRIAEGVPEPYDVEVSIAVEGDHEYGTYHSEESFVMAVPLRRIEGWPVQAGDIVYSSPAIADLDGDGPKEVVLGCHDGRVYAWSSDGSRLPGWPVETGDKVIGKPAVCDIDVDGSLEVIVASLDSCVYAFRSDGTVSPGWPRRTEGPVHSSCLLADLDDDGMVEIVATSMDGMVYAWNEDGSKVPGWPVDVGGFGIYMSPGAADVDGDHLPEIVAGGYGGKLYIFDGDGTPLEGFPVMVGPGCGRGSPAMADFDGDGTLEIAISALFSNSIYLVGLDGQVKPGWPSWSYNCGNLSSPVAADIDNDGLPEVAVSTSCGTIVAWNSDGTPCRALEARGSDPIQYCEPVFLDLDGNGSIEGVVGTTRQGGSRLYAFGGEGTLTGFPVEVSGEVWATPAVGDLDGDGYTEIVTATTSGDVYLWRFIGAKGTGRTEYSQQRGNLWNTGLYGFVAKENVPLPDLAMSAGDVAFDPVEPRQEETVRIEARVWNAGHDRTGPFRVGAYADEVCPENLIDAVDVGDLEAKAETTVVFDWPVPGGAPTRLVRILVDPDSTVFERTELNNLAGKRFYLSLADLAVTIRDVEPFPVIVGDSVQVRTALENRGRDVARFFSLGFYDSTTDISRRFARFDVDSLAPGESAEFETSHLIQGFPDDFIRIIAAVDLEEEVLEYHLDNNRASWVVNSGIAGETIETPYDIPIEALSTSRTLIAARSHICNCIFVARNGEPFDIRFETPGDEMDLARNTMVFSSQGDIAGYDFSDSTFFIVSTEPDLEYRPAVWAGNVVWVASSAGSSRVRLRRGMEPARTLRSLVGGEIGAVDVSYALAVWEESDGSQTDLWGYDLRSDSLFSVYSGPGDQVNPTCWGEWVVWEDRSGDGGDVMMLDVATGEITTLSDAPGLQRNPHLYGNMVVWQDSRNGNWDIYGYDLAEGAGFPVSRQVSDQTIPSLSDSTVYWVDGRGGGEALRGLRFGGKRLAASLVRLEAQARDGEIRLVLGVKPHEDGLSYRYYRYPDGRVLGEDRHTHIRTEFDLGPDSVHVFCDTLVAARRPFYYTLGIIDAYGEETLHGPVNAVAYERAPEFFSMGNARPNPFRHQTDFYFGLPRRVSGGADEGWEDPSNQLHTINVSIYSVTGQVVRTLQAGELSPGYYRVTWDGTNEERQPVSPGVYFVGTMAGGRMATRKVILLK
jgi:immune inhibitor A